MKIDILEDNVNILRFRLNGATNAYANVLRRAAIGSVPAFAIDTVTIYENSSSMFDEYIAHRIGLIPISTPAKGYNTKDEVLFTLEAEGPKTVYSSEIKSSDKEVKVSNGAIPVIKLAEGQRIRLDGKARLGTGSMHAKFQPGLVTYEQKAEDEFEFYVEAFGQMPPRQIINKALGSIEEQAEALAAKATQL